MPEKKSSLRLQGGAGAHVSRNYGRLKNMSADELLFEFEAEMDKTTDSNYDGELIDAYLAALDEKAPLDAGLDAEASWNEFRMKHANLFEKDVGDENGSAAESPRKTAPRRLLPRIIAIAAVVTLFSMLCVQAAGFNLFGAFGKWTEEIFGFLSADGGSGADSSEFTAKDSNADACLQLKVALSRCGIAEELAPEWYPEGFEAESPQVQSSDMGDIVYCNFFNENDDTIVIRITRYNDPSKMKDPFYEKDDASVEEYVNGERIFYIFSNLESTTATWSDGATLAISIFGNISVDELKNIIDSIGG